MAPDRSDAEPGLRAMGAEARARRPAPARPYVLDASWQRFERVVVAGSPLRIFRLAARGLDTVLAIEAGTSVEPSRLVDRLLDGGAIHPRSDVETTPRYGALDVTMVTPQLGGTRPDDGRIVIDDGSEPPLAGATRRLPATRGPAAARNAGRAFVETELVAFVDADVELPPGWMTRLLPHFDDPAVGVVAPRVLGERGSPLDLGAEPARIRAGTRVSYVPGAALVVRVAALDSVGGFDEKLRFGEDVDLVWRLDAAGWHGRYEPGATVWHRPRPTLRARLRQHASYGTSAAPLALRHPHALAPLRSNGWTAAAWASAAVGHPIVGVALAVGSAGALPSRLPDVPSRASFELAMRGHLGAAAQLASAIRRTWWPIVAVAALISRRVRRIAVVSLLAGGRSTPTDLAYGWGVWQGVLRHRTIAPIRPRIAAWPKRHADRRYRQSP